MTQDRHLSRHLKELMWENLQLQLGAGYSSLYGEFAARGKIDNKMTHQPPISTHNPHPIPPITISPGMIAEWHSHWSTLPHFPTAPGVPVYGRVQK